jgi:hypothetical protein
VADDDEDGGRGISTSAPFRSACISARLALMALSFAYCSASSLDAQQQSGQGIQDVHRSRALGSMGHSLSLQQ